MLYDGRRTDWPRRDVLEITWLPVVPNIEAGIRKNYWGCTILMQVTNGGTMPASCM
jgi:hypothetical protein